MQRGTCDFYIMKGFYYPLWHSSYDNDFKEFIAYQFLSTGCCFYNEPLLSSKKNIIVLYSFIIL